MIILDATSIIAFLKEMNCPDSLKILSKKEQLVVPLGVVDEITKSPEKEILNVLINNKFLSSVEVEPQLKNRIEKENITLHGGECECIAYAIINNSDPNLTILSDDSNARKKFKNLKITWTEDLLEKMNSDNLIDQKTFDQKTKELSNSPFYSKKVKN